MSIKLLNYPKEISNFSRVRCIEKNYENDLKELIEHSGDLDAFKGIYKQRLQFLNEQKEKCFLRFNWFERLKYDPEHRLYSMKFNSRRLTKNMRILFICTKDYSILLNAFIENSDTAYRKNIEIANQRLKELIDSSDLKGEDILCHNI